MRHRLAVTTLGISVIAACAAGDLGSAGSAALPSSGGDGGALPATVDGGAPRDAAVGPTGSGDDAGSNAGPGIFDGGPPVVIGGGSNDGATDAGDDAPADTGVDARVCGPPSSASSYASTCTGCSTTGNTLTCACKNKAQTPVPTSLDMCTCTQPPVIANTDGVLTCP